MTHTRALRAYRRALRCPRTYGVSLAKENNCEKEKEGRRREKGERREARREKERYTNVRINEERYIQREKNRGCVSSRANARVCVYVCVYLSRVHTFGERG